MSMTERQKEIVENLFLARGDAYTFAVSLLYSLLLKDAMCLQLADAVGPEEANELLESPGSLVKALSEQTVQCAIVLSDMVPGATVADLTRDARILAASARKTHAR